MKYDGHVKLTRQALEKIKYNCPVAGDICKAPMFSTAERLWLSDENTSNASDNYSSAIVNYLFHNLTPAISSIHIYAQ